MFIGRFDAESEASILWPPDVNRDSLEKTLIWERLKAEREKGNRG